ncbi:MAG: glycoside hydrolase family 125 protein, partial [Longimicrobiales bacterium]
HYLTFSHIARATGAVHAVNILHRGLLGLVEWNAQREPSAGGDAFLTPFVRVDGEDVPFPSPRWDRLDRWIPTFRTERPELILTGTICAPGGYDPLVRGGVLLLEIHGRGTEHAIEVGVEGCWRWTRRCAASSRPLAGSRVLARGTAEQGLALEVDERVALALVGGPETRYTWAHEDDPFTAAEPATERTAAAGEALRFRATRTVKLRPGRRVAVPFYLGVALERDGALATGAYLAGRGHTELLRLARLDLARIVRSGRETQLLARLNRNLVFCHYCAVARAVDDDRLYPVASRMTQHGPTAVFDERTALLWTLPALTVADALLAREVLVRAFELYSDRPGQRTRYIDGGILAPGFALDQLCAYGIALERYVEQSGDEALLDEPLIQDVLREIDEHLWSRLHPQVFLCATELLPSGDPADQPYAAYPNALLWRLCRAIPRIWHAAQGEAPARLASADDEIQAAFWQRCTADVDGLQVIACSSDLEGHVTVYDDPSGSLRLLPHLGFCPEDDPIWSNTMDLFHSDDYPLWLGDRPHPGLAARSAPDRASFAALCADLLTSRRDRALEVLRGLVLEGDVACIAWDPDTGRGSTGPYDAALAGFLAWTLDQARQATPAGGKGNRR